MTTSEITADDLDAALARCLPLHGPYDGDRSLTAADAVHELVRYLNYATQHPADGVPYASTAGGVLGNLAAGVDGLDQLGGQLADRVAMLAASPYAYVYGGAGRDTSRDSVSDTIDELRDQLAGVADLSRTLARALRTAQTLADRIGTAEPEHAEEDR